jgi:hypothetical protein
MLAGIDRFSSTDRLSQRKVAVTRKFEIRVYNQRTSVMKRRGSEEVQAESFSRLIFRLDFSAGISPPNLVRATMRQHGQPDR